MCKAELFRRYLVFFIAISIAAVGVTLVTRSTLGVNSVACFSYVSSVYFPVTMGSVTIAFNALCWISEYFIIKPADRRRSLPNLIAQIPALVIFGLLVDLCMYLTTWIVTDNYALKMLTLLIGIGLICINIAMQASSNVTMLSCDGFVKLLADRINRHLGTIKLIFDLSLVGSAALMSLICSHWSEIVGIREGTVIGAVIIGPIVQVMYAHCGKLRDWMAQPGLAHQVSAK